VKHWLETSQVLARLAEVHGAGGSAALATVVRVRGSAYRHEGAKLLVEADGRTTGNVSGGCLELDVREVALRVIATGVAERRRYCSGTDQEAAWDLGVGCEGEVEVWIAPVRDDHAAERAALRAEQPFQVVQHLDPASAPQRSVGPASHDAPHLRTSASGDEFVDVLIPPPRLVVVGAGDDAIPLVRLALEVGFRVAVADRRPGLLVPGRFPAAARLVETDSAALATAVPLDSDTSVVIMTHHFIDDRDYLAAVLPAPVPYIGVLGPRARTERILGVLGVDDDPRLYAPVGLDIGTDGAEQVAIAVVAELLMVRSGRPAHSLRERRAPIHA
jgi:xanthine/CO dehydrogenase XdhC/CoxF family maturation factor